MMAKWDDLIGKPYVRGGRGPDAYDCYGLLRELYIRDGIRLPDYESPEDAGRVTALFALELRLWEPCRPSPGAAAYIRFAVPGGGIWTHCAYLLSPDYMVHTWERSGGVVRERVGEWQRRIRGFYRYAA